MSENNTVLCASNHYTRKYYFNPKFSILPKDVQDELKIMCVLFTEEAGGILTIEYKENGTLELKTEASGMDSVYDEIEAGLKIREMQKKHQELFESLELFYRVFKSTGRLDS